MQNFKLDCKLYREMTYTEICYRPQWGTWCRQDMAHMLPFPPGPGMFPCDSLNTGMPPGH